MDGDGATVKEAKADAGRKIQRALAEMSKAPVIVSVDGPVAVVAYDLGSGWGHPLIAYPGDDAYPRPGPQYVSGAFPKQHEATLHAAQHVLDLCWEPDAADDEARYHAITSKPFGAPMNHTERREMRRKILEGWSLAAALSDGARRRAQRRRSPQHRLWTALKDVPMKLRHVNSAIAALGGDA
jgi:hypothetical protein